jgi:hypothetical protein
VRSCRHRDLTNDACPHENNDSEKPGKPAC